MNKTTIIAEPGKLDLFITREFDAPRELVFKAHIDPALFVQWCGPRGYKMNITEMDATSGGKWAYTHADGDAEYQFHGCFHEVTPSERIIQTFEFDGMPEKGHVSLETITFEELPGNRTRLTGHSVFMSLADRDGMIEAGMEKGVVDGYERLDELMEKQK